MKLISMTDFIIVLPVDTDMPDDFEGGWRECAKELDRIMYYANFLKQPLNLGMFVPCDEDGTVLTEATFTDWESFSTEREPEHIQEVNEQETEEWEIWCEAKDRVLFEGFEKYDDGKSFAKTVIGISKTVEGLVPHDFTLTPTAIKQLGLELETA